MACCGDFHVSTLNGLASDVLSDLISADAINNLDKHS
jgi:hypothetical protein